MAEWLPERIARGAQGIGTFQFKAEALIVLPESVLHELVPIHVKIDILLKHSDNFVLNDKRCKL